jgi:hypothetical protein
MFETNYTISIERSKPALTPYTTIQKNLYQNKIFKKVSLLLKKTHYNSNTELSLAISSSRLGYGFYLQFN